MDLEDLKLGKLDRIEERQAKDPDAKANSVIIIIKEKEVIRERTIPSPWYWPYAITIQNPIWYTVPTIPTPNWTCCTSNGNSALSSYDNAISVNCSLAKDYSIGTYDIDGKIINFR